MMKLPLPHGAKTNHENPCPNPPATTSNPKPSGGLTLHGAKHVQWNWTIIFMLLGLSIYQRRIGKTEISSNLSNRNLAGSPILLTYYSRSLKCANTTKKTLWCFDGISEIQQNNPIRTYKDGISVIEQQRFQKKSRQVQIQISWSFTQTFHNDI